MPGKFSSLKLALNSLGQNLVPLIHKRLSKTLRQPFCVMIKPIITD